MRVPLAFALVVIGAIGACRRGGADDLDIAPDRTKAQKGATSTGDPTTVVAAPGTFFDPVTKRPWTIHPEGPMDWAKAETFCTTVSISGAHWRLPTRAELEALADPSASPAGDPDPEARRLREPFASALGESGYLFSGELIAPPDQPWIMNLRNAHVFNGQGYVGFVLCVKSAKD